MNDFKGQSKDFMVATHRYMQDAVIDPQHAGTKWQIDGCQMDTALSVKAARST